MQRICKYCGAEYSGDPGSTACPACVAKLRSSTIRDRVCRSCGVTFPGGPRAWYCPDCRVVRRRESDRRHSQAVKTGEARKIGSTDLCQICGQPYTVTGSLQKYCPDCAPDAIRAIDRQQSIAWQRANITPEQRWEERQAGSAQIPCAVCGTLFSPSDASLTCSKSCQAIYAKMRSAAWERAHRAQRNEYHKQLRKLKKEDNHDD